VENLVHVVFVLFENFGGIYHKRNLYDPAHIQLILFFSVLNLYISAQNLYTF
jgi:hypothetical protein